jgi:hypothetical protein
LVLEPDVTCAIGLVVPHREPMTPLIDAMDDPQIGIRNRSIGIRDRPIRNIAPDYENENDRLEIQIVSRRAGSGFVAWVLFVGCAAEV